MVEVYNLKMLPYMVSTQTTIINRVMFYSSIQYKLLLIRQHPEASKGQN